jgi:serine/threonine-protein kinase
MPEEKEEKKRAKQLTFGQIAIAHKFAEPEQVLEAVLIQKKMKQMGLTPKKIGEILVEKGFITQKQAENIFKIQGREGGHRQIEGYRFIKKLGEGSMGAVFQAKQLSMDRMVAIKVLSPKFNRNQKFVERFMREARAVAKLNHINIISGIDVGESNGINYFAMEFVNGPTVISILRRGGAIDEKRSLNIAVQVARALEHANKNGLVHRDIKPDNVMITKDGTAKLCDLGLARQAGKQAGTTESGMSVGTPNYISPEQARGDTDIDIRSDIYSLGATLFHMVTGRPPFSGSAAVVMMKHISEEAPVASQVNPDLSEQSAHLITHMMAKNPGARYQTPAALIEDMERILKGQPIKGAVRKGDSAVLAEIHVDEEYIEPDLVVEPGSVPEIEIEAEEPGKPKAPVKKRRRRGRRPRGRRRRKR